MILGEFFPYQALPSRYPEKAQNAAEHTIILDGITCKQATHCINYKVSAHSPPRLLPWLIEEWPDLMSDSWRQGRDVLMLVVSMITRSAICQSSLLLDLCKINLALLLPSSTQWLTIKRGALLSVVLVKWRHTRSRLMTGPSILVESRGLKPWKDTSSLSSVEMACLILKCSHPLIKKWMKALMLSSPQIKIEIPTLDHKHPSTWPKDLAPDPGHAYIDKSFDADGDYVHRHVSQAISSLTCDDGPPLKPR